MTVAYTTVRGMTLREAADLMPALDAAEQSWRVVGQPAADDLRFTVASVEAELGRDDLNRIRQRIASRPDHSAPEFEPVKHYPLSVDREVGHDGIGR